jgi:dTDP-4-dehydrorhamnose 3,5-epimerase
MIDDLAVSIEGLIVSPLKQIENPRGYILHAMKIGSEGFLGFGEAYFSSVNKGEIKGWKKHQEMTLNLIVPTGEIRFVIYDDREHSLTNNQVFDINLSRDNYYRLTVPPGLWLGFQGVSADTNLLLNIANIEHNPDESINIPLKEIKFDWGKSE